MKIKSLFNSTIWTIILITIITILSELSSSFKTFLQNITGHHWITKSFFSIVAFIILYLAFSKFSKETFDIKKETYRVITITVLCGLILLIFYI